MEHLDYDAAQEDLIVVVAIEDGTIFAEVAINSVLLKMLSPWWKTRLTATGFKSQVQDCRCTVIHDTPEVAEMALRAAKLRFDQKDLQAEADLNSIFKLWRLADMWQFSYLSNMCQGAMTHVLTQTDEDSIKEFVDTAMQHSDTILDDVLLPLLLENPELRSAKLFLAFEDRIMFTLAERAPIAGLQTCSADYNNRLTQYASSLDDNGFVTFMLTNLEARCQELYASRSLECCMLLFAEAPLPLVSSMIALVLTSEWNKEQKEMAMLAIDFDRVVSHDIQYFEKIHKLLPDVSHVWHALWRASNRKLKNRHLSISCAQPWVVTFSDEYASDAKHIKAGPIEVVVRGRYDAWFHSKVPAYGILRSHSGELWSWSDELCFCEVIQPGKQFCCAGNSVLVIYESATAVVLDKPKFNYH